MLFTVENGHQRPDHIIEPLLIIKRKTSLSHFEQYPFEHGRSNDRIARRGFLGNTVKYSLGLIYGQVRHIRLPEARQCKGNPSPTCRFT